MHNDTATHIALSSMDITASMCRYQSKRCTNPRALKKNGKYHNLCEEHRAKANGNQRKLDKKKRLSGKASTSKNRFSPFAGIRKQVQADVTMPLKGRALPVVSPKIHKPELENHKEDDLLNVEDFNFLADCFGANASPIHVNQPDPIFRIGQPEQTPWSLFLQNETQLPAQC